MNRITFTTPKGEGFIAEFDRDICASMEERNLTPEQVGAKPAAKLLIFFAWAFKKNHPKVSRNVTDEIWEGLPSEGKKQVFETQIISTNTITSNIFFAAFIITDSFQILLQLRLIEILLLLSPTSQKHSNFLQIVNTSVLYTP